MGKVTLGYGRSQPGDGCFMMILAASVVLILIFLCIYAAPLLWKIEPIPETPECVTHSCMYTKP